jgi:serine/threonine-protein kinase
LETDPVARRHCDANRLRLLLEDALPTPKEAELVHHLDDCRDCQQALEKLAAEKRWWDELPQLNELGRHAGDGTSSKKGDAVAGTSSGGVSATAFDSPHVQEQGGPFALDFLDPAEDAEHLGKLDGFDVSAVLGRGGMGVVLKAFDAALNRPVAIKVLAPYFASSGAARARFDREAKAAAAVVHPHIVAIHSVASWKGLPYLVMSYVAGRSLQERLDSDGPLELKEILRIGMQTAAGLAAAHAQGLVHRDVKPANILLENGVGRVWLTDFGLARAVDDASLTQSGVIAGTPQYMAPEQAQGHSVDHRADLFSLGSTLYAMCTARAPFRADSAMAVLRRVCDDKPRSLRTLNPDVPPWLAAIIDKLHAKKPGDRFQTAAEVAELFEKCLAHVQQPESNPAPLELARLLPRPRRRARLAAVALVGIFTLGAAEFVWSRLQHGIDRRENTVPKRADQANRPNTTRIEESSLEQQVDGLRSRATAVETDLKQQFVPGLGDPSEQLLLDTRRRLDALERELATKSP